VAPGDPRVGRIEWDGGAIATGSLRLEYAGLLDGSPPKSKGQVPIFYVIVPGMGGSDAEHWQSGWQVGLGTRATRTRVASWDEPDRADGVRAIGAGVAQSSTDRCVLVAHSLGCLASGPVAVRCLGTRTGNRQEAAISFYTRHGFARIGRFPPYLNSDTSICMELAIGG
jgi:hypothetical protein